MTFWFLALIFALAASALCAGSETGFYGLNPMRLRHAAGESRRAALLEKVVRSPAGLLTALLIGNNFANDLAVRAAIHLAESFQLADAALWATLILTPLVFAFGEVLPKQWTLRAPLRSMLVLAIPLAALRTLMWPLTAPLVAGARLFGGGGEAALARRELGALLQEGQRQTPAEARVMTAALRALDSRGKGLAPFLRSNLPLIPPDAPISAALDAARAGDGLVLVDRGDRPPALIVPSRLLEAGQQATPGRLAYPLLQLPPGLDLAGALERMRAYGVAFAWAREESGAQGLCDLEYALARLLSPAPPVTPQEDER